jgi:GTPase-associated protein 1, N-terminal domain type 2
MPAIHTLQHLFGSVERGFFPHQGPGFQTVAVAAELVGTDDLRALEEAAFYSVSRERLTAHDFPIKETFFRLPSGRFAIGRTVNWGRDPLGREGNYLARHVVLTRDDLIALGGNPFAILDTPELAQTGVDLTPRELPPMALATAPPPDLRDLEGSDRELLAHLAIAVVDGGETIPLIIGDEARSREVIRGLFSVLAIEERLRLTFSTHFHESEHLRSRFALAAVRSRAEAPSERQSYAVFDLDEGEFSKRAPASAYADWLAACLRAGRWAEIDSVNGVLDHLRSGQDCREGDPLPMGEQACAALWERAGTEVTRLLVGEPGRIVGFLRHVPSPRPLADALLATASPDTLCGAGAEPDVAGACLQALRSTASPKLWRTWVKRWETEPLLAPFAQDARPWWRRWR